MSLVVVGSVAYDSVETAFGRRDDLLGGSATYFSVAASLFTEPALVAVVGEDFRDEDARVLEERQVDLSGLERTAGHTFRWGGRYHEDMNGRDSLYTLLNVFESFRPKLGERHRDASVVFLANIHPGLQMEVLDQVRAPRFVAADTMNFWIDGAREDLARVLARVDALFLNDAEAVELTGRRTMLQAARAIQDMGPQLVVIKRGEHGAIVFNGDDVFYAPAWPLERVVDPTGAGDTFAGGFMGFLARAGSFSPANVRRAAVAGTLMASFCVEGFGLEALREVSLEAVRTRYQAYGTLMAFEPLTL